MYTFFSTKEMRYITTEMTSDMEALPQWKYKSKHFGDSLFFFLFYFILDSIS